MRSTTSPSGASLLELRGERGAVAVRQPQVDERHVEALARAAARAAAQVAAPCTAYPASSRISLQVVDQGRVVVHDEDARPLQRWLMRWPRAQACWRSTAASSAPVSKGFGKTATGDTGGAIAQPRHDQHGQPRELRGQTPHRLAVGAARHAQVDQRAERPDGPEPLRLQHRAGGHGREAAAAQGLAEVVAQGGVVLDDRHQPVASGARRAARAGAGSGTGFGSTARSPSRRAASRSSSPTKAVTTMAASAWVDPAQRGAPAPRRP